MATLSYDLDKPRQDGSRKVSITLSHNGKRKRIPTSITLQRKDVSRKGNITSATIQRAIDARMNELRERLYDLEAAAPSKDMDIGWLYSRLARRKEDLDFFTFADQWLQKSSIKGKKNYHTMLNALRRFHGSGRLPFSLIDYGFLERFCKSLDGHPRAKSLYLGGIRHLYNEAAREYNTQQEQLVPPSPFASFKIPKHTPQTNDRVISEEDLAKLLRFQGTRRIGLARDCYILSFCLMGMNSVDLYECRDYHGGVLSYDRMKTKDRRADHAHIEIKVPSIIKPLMLKYKGDSRVFDFHRRYTNASNFNKHLNKGLAIIAKRLGMPRFDFYSARHTWASIARNRLGIDKYTIHEALNHASDLDVTDIYIQRDYTNINKANAQVMQYIQSLLDKG